MTCSTNVCTPQQFRWFQACDFGETAGKPPVNGCVTNNWEICKEGDKTRVKLDGGYSLEFNEKHSEIFIIKPCGEKTRIWGDPHVDFKADGKNDFDFYGTTSFQLKDGTKITINTEPWKGNPGMTLANNVVVTKGEKSLIVDGLSQNKLGDFTIEKGLNGRALDRAVWDGKLTVHENPKGGWMDETGGVVDQNDGNRTKIVAGDPTQISYADQKKLIEKPCTPPPVCPPADHCAPRKPCFSWLEALASVFAEGLTRQIDKMSAIYTKLQTCYEIKSTTCFTTLEECQKYCDKVKAMGGDDANMKIMGDIKNYTYDAKANGGKGGYVPNEACVKAADQGAAYWQQMLTASAQQLQITAQTGMTVQNSASQALTTVARAG